MRSHPAVAVEILSPIRMLQSILPLIRGHHERWDGKGYPDGIQGEAIPLGARVIAVADAYDAMVTDRPYRTGFPREKAREVLQMGAGTQWDTTAVDALLFVQTHANKNNTQPSNPSHHLVRDPVCSMVVVLEVAQAQVIFDDQVVYFCSTACRELFDRNPLIYMRGLSP
jgi:HD-GYP domain-containing protein (c-di-GMP phosphodiesterase class II)